METAKGWSPELGVREEGLRAKGRHWEIWGVRPQFWVLVGVAVSQPYYVFVKTQNRTVSQSMTMTICK